MSRIVTFYSYKGGVGRTFALANVAVLLAKRGKRVLLMDWDLEAPGLHRYFNDLLASKSASDDGLIHMLTKAAEDSAVDWRPYVARAELPDCPILDVIPSGDRSSDYVDKVRDFSWTRFFEHRHGGDVLDRWRNEWKKSYDFVLVDSRTGITDTGGVCTVFLPDILVLVFSANKQSFERGVQVANGIQDARRKLAVPRPPVTILPVPGRFDGRDEVDEANRWLEIFAHELKPFYDDWLPMHLQPRQILELTKIPYISKFSFGEPLPVISYGITDPDGPGFYLENVARLLVSEFGDAARIISGDKADDRENALISYASEEEFLTNLITAVDHFDRDQAARMCNGLIGALQEGIQFSVKTRRVILQTLRRKCYFDLMERAVDAFRLSGFDDNQLRRQYAQSLIDQGKVRPALEVLESLIARTINDPDEADEARGLLGRVYKQLYVNEVNADPKAAAMRLNQLNLQRAVNSYYEVYLTDADLHLWHGINTVALALRAKRDGVRLNPEPDAAAIAQRILNLIAIRKGENRLSSWDMATAAEACIALGKYEEALRWCCQYVQDPGIDAFELASIERQLREVWGLTVNSSPGSLLLPLLQSQVLQRTGGQVDVARGSLGATIDQTANRVADGKLEKILGETGAEVLEWYKQGLERCQSVAQIRTETNEGIGTGFLVRGGDLAAALGDEPLLLTAAHVVSDDPGVQLKHGALSPAEVTIVFEELPVAADKAFRPAKLLWTSPPDKLDATLLQLEPKITNLTSYPIAKVLPVIDNKQRIYIIGHPGGRSLSLSLQDNLLLDHESPFIHYRTPTEYGSGGSPVFNQQWKLIGLHHAGDRETNRLNGKLGTYQVNEGIWIGAIMEALAQHFSDAFAK